MVQWEEESVKFGKENMSIKRKKDNILREREREREFQIEGLNMGRTYIGKGDFEDLAPV